jgi:hypothetical protein
MTLAAHPWLSSYRRVATSQKQPILVGMAFWRGLACKAQGISGHRAGYGRCKQRPSSYSLAFPDRLARFLLCLFWSNSDVLELAIIHLH